MDILEDEINKLAQSFYGKNWEELTTNEIDLMALYGVVETEDSAA